MKILASLAVIGILPPIITPFRENGDVDYDAFIRNIERWNNDPLAGYLVLGSNSETPYLGETEKLKLIELIILAGTGLESTQETIRLTNRAARLGAHAAFVLTPFYISVSAAKVLSQHPNIVGSASAWYAALKLGIRAAILAVANCLPKSCAEIQRLFDRNEHRKAKELQDKTLS